MKKIILLILMLVPSFQVSADIMYGNYYPYILDTYEYIEESNQIKREEFKLFNTYRLTRKDIGYEENCEYYDEDNFIETITYSDTKINENDKLYQSYPYSGHYITMFGFSNVLNSKITINEIVVKANNKIIPFRIDRNIANSDYLQDGDLDTKLTLYKGENFDCYIDEVVLAEDLTIEFIADTIIDSEFRLKTKKNTTETFHNRFYINTEIIEFVTKEEENQIKEVVGNYNNKDITNHYYKNSKKKYLCYTYEKNILNNYVLEGENIIEDDYKIKYNYYKRDIIEIPTTTTTLKTTPTKKKTPKKTTKKATTNPSTTTYTKKATTTKTTITKAKPKEFKKKNTIFKLIIITSVLLLLLLMFILNK